MGNNLYHMIISADPMKVPVMDNGHAMATDGQPIPPGLLERVLSGRSPM
jgi:hypothetical protein